MTDDNNKFHQKNQDFTVSLENAFLDPHLPAFLGLKVLI